MTTGPAGPAPGGDPPGRRPPGTGAPREVPPDVAVRLVNALDRAPSTVTTLVDADLTTCWISRSATWVTGTDPDSRAGRQSLERVHPDDVERLLHGLAQLRAASPTGAPTIPMEPLRYRVRRADGTWLTMETLVHNLLDDPVVRGLVLIGRPVDGELDGVGHVVDLLVADAPLPEVLAACAGLVPGYLGSAAIVALIDGAGEPVIGAPAGGPAERLAADDRWWRETLSDGRMRAPVDFDGFADDLAERARAEGFLSAWVLPLRDASTSEVTGCVAVWVRIAIERNIATDDGLRQTERLASLVVGEQRRHHALRRQAVTDPLTGIGNRSALRRRLDEGTEPLTVAIIDLDAFKPVNDTHGHDTGDAVLRIVAERLVGAVREDDLVVRFGGDEFAVVFADGTPPEGVAGSVQRITDTIEAPMALGGGRTINVGASIGLATATPGEVVHLADAELYQAKRRKRLIGSNGSPSRRPVDAG